MAVNLNFDYKQFEGPAPPDPAQRLQRLMSLRDMEARAEDRRMGRELQAANLESLAAERDSHIAYQQEQQAKLETEREAKSAEQAARGMLAKHLKKGGGRTLDDFYGAVGPTYAAKFFGEYADAAEKQAKADKEAHVAFNALGDDMAGLLVRLSSAGVPPAEIHEELGRYGASLQNQFKDDPIRGPMVEELVNDDDLRAGEAGWQRYVARSGHASEEQRKINEDKRKADLDALNQQEKQAQLDKIQAETALLGRETFPAATATAQGFTQFGTQGTAILHPEYTKPPTEKTDNETQNEQELKGWLGSPQSKNYAQNAFGYSEYKRNAELQKSQSLAGTRSANTRTAGEEATARKEVANAQRGLTDARKRMAAMEDSFKSIAAGKPPGAHDMIILSNHIGMTFGDVKGARTGRDLIEAHVAAKSLPERLAVAAQHVLNGGVLSKEQREEFLAAARDRVTELDEEYGRTKQIWDYEPPGERKNEKPPAKTPPGGSNDGWSIVP